MRPRCRSEARLSRHSSGCCSNALSSSPLAALLRRAGRHFALLGRRAYTSLSVGHKLWNGHGRPSTPTSGARGANSRRPQDSRALRAQKSAVAVRRSAVVVSVSLESLRCLAPPQPGSDHAAPNPVAFPVKGCEGKLPVVQPGAALVCSGALLALCFAAREPVTTRIRVESACASQTALRPPPPAGRRPEHDISGRAGRARPGRALSAAIYRSKYQALSMYAAYIHQQQQEWNCYR